MDGKPTDHDPRWKMIQRVEKKHRVELDKLDTKARLKTLDKYVRAELRREATSEAMAKVRARSRPEAAKKIHKVPTHLAKLRKAHPKEFDKVVNQIEEIVQEPLIRPTKPDPQGAVERAAAALRR